MVDCEVFKKYLNTARNFNYRNGLVCTDIGDGYAEFEVELSQWSMNSQNIAHGSLIFALCDEAAGIAASASGRSTVTQCANINFLRPGLSGKLYARSTRIREGRQTALYETVVTDEAGKLLAKATITFFYTGREVKISEDGAELHHN